jgi:hypothetical protein
MSPSWGMVRKKGGKEERKKGRREDREKEY